MKTVCLHEKDEIEAILRQDTPLHIYELGDLDDFFWQHTTWYGLRDGDQFRQVVLLYTGTELPVLLALTADPAGPLRDLLRSILPLLPRRLYAHLSGDLTTVLAEDYDVQPHGLHHKMVLADPAQSRRVDASAASPLSAADLPAIEALYRTAYPGNWFDPRMLETGQYFGLRRGGELVSIAGIHVYSPRYRVAALGNITTHPAFRGQGLAQAVTARLCQSLLQTVDTIGLNVRADNSSAIACYEKLGFEWTGSYGEYMLELRERR